LPDAEILAMIAEIVRSLDVGPLKIHISHAGIAAEILRLLSQEFPQGATDLDRATVLADIRGGQLKPKSPILRFIGEARIQEGDYGSQRAAFSKAAKGNAPIQGALEKLDATVADTEIFADEPVPIVLDVSQIPKPTYYSGITVRTFLAEQQELGSVVTGGRYEKLFGSRFGEGMSGVGASIRFTKIYNMLLRVGIIDCVRRSRSDLIVLLPARSTIQSAVAIGRHLRGQGLRVELYDQDRPIEDQLQDAKTKGIPFAVVPWPHTLDSDAVELRCLNTGRSKVVTCDSIFSEMQRLSKTIGANT